MKKNVVVIPWVEREKNINNIGSGKAGRTKGYKYGIDSWKKWCKKHDVDFFLMSELMVDESEMLITWQRWYVLEILENSGVEYEQVLLVDADCIVHPNCPNFFKITDNKFSTSFANGDFEWINRAIKSYSQLFFDTNYLMMASEFFQTGFVIVNETHRKFLSDVQDFYWKNKDKIIESFETIRTGSDQPLINLLTKKFEVDVNILPHQYSMMDLWRKNLLFTDHRQWWEDDLSNLYNSAWIYQFNAIPQNELGRNQSYWMERIYTELYK